MKLYNLTKSLGFLGLLEILLTIVWFNGNRDPSQMFLYLGGGVLILVFSYIYQWMKVFQKEILEQNGLISSQNTKILELQRWVTEQEKNKQ